MKIVRLLLAVIFVLSFLSFGHAAQISFNSVTGIGNYWTDVNGSPVKNGDLGLLTDNYLPPKGTPWYQDTVVFGPAIDGDQVIDDGFIFDMGASFLLEDVTIAIDNNDDYHVIYSLDGINYAPLFVVDASYGSVPVNPGGTDIFSTDINDLNYLAAIDFDPVMAQFIGVYGDNGDYGYTFSELQAFGSAPVPEPATIILLGTGLLGLAGASRRKLKM